jgi:hypothetical protein
MVRGFAASVWGFEDATLCRTRRTANGVLRTLLRGFEDANFGVLRTLLRGFEDGLSKKTPTYQWVERPFLASNYTNTKFNIVNTRPSVASHCAKPPADHLASPLEGCGMRQEAHAQLIGLAHARKKQEVAWRWVRVATTSLKPHRSARGEGQERQFAILWVRVAEKMQPP